MSLFSDVEVGELEALAEQAMPETASIVHGTWTNAGRGGRTFVPSGTVTSSCGWMAVHNQRGEQLGATGGPEATLDARLRFPAGTDVRATDQLTINSTRYDVQGIELRGTAWEAVRIVQVRRVGQVSA